MTTPLVSILLPAYNAAATLPACLRSIERQTETRWECVLVDDGSTDATPAIAEAAARRDDRFRNISITHRGLVNALNAGLEGCGGRFIARMDADDLMHSRRLMAQVHALESATELAAIGTHVRLFPRGALLDGRRAYERWLNDIDSPERVRQEMFVECPIAHPTLMARREVLLAGYRDVGWPEDYDLVLRLLTRGHRIGVVSARLLSWRDAPRRLSRIDPRYAVERFVACKATFLAGHFLAQSDRYILWGFGHTARAMHRALAARGKHASHIIELHPGRLGMIIHGAKVIAPADLTRVPRRPIIASVAGEAPRRQIREALEGYGFRELRDFVCAA